MMPKQCDDRNSLLATVKIDGSILEYVDESLHTDREMILAAVKE